MHEPCRHRHIRTVARPWSFRVIAFIPSLSAAESVAWYRDSLESRTRSRVQIMGTTTKFITSPAPETITSPIHNYTEEQQAQLRALREVVYTFQISTLPFLFLFSFLGVCYDLAGPSLSDRNDRCSMQARCVSQKRTHIAIASSDGLDDRTLSRGTCALRSGS